MSPSALFTHERIQNIEWILHHLQHSHVVVGGERDVQQFSPCLDTLVTGSADHLSCHPARREKKNS